MVNHNMKTNPLISIIVPIYNVEAYLEKCIDSILAQDYTPLEIILVNDGATDGSGAICDKYAKQYENITALHKKMVDYLLHAMLVWKLCKASMYLLSIAMTILLQI